jgi:enoyl-[acyl-carrier protein] reductase II
MQFNNKITQLLKIDLPIIQAGMVWASEWQLASAVSNAGGLGVLGSGSMYPPQLIDNIQKCKQATNNPFAVNVPLLYPSLQEHINIIISEKVPIVITSAGNPATYTQMLKDNGIIVIHVVSSSKFAQKAQQAGCHAVVAEGFEAGGHNGRNETTTMVLVPQVINAVSIPVIAAGGIATGAQMAAAFALGADAVQVGSRFVASTEASSHINFKNAVINSTEGDTKLAMKQLMPVRLLKNEFYNQVAAAEAAGATADELKELLGRGRAKLGMYQGNLTDGELEIGQVSSMLHQILPAKTIVENLWNEFLHTCKSLGTLAQ